MRIALAMSGGRFRVLGLMALSNPIGVGDGWTASVANTSSGSPRAIASVSTILPQILRRRVTPIGQMALRVAHPFAEATSEARYIVCSRHGEFSRTLGLLHSAVAREPMSPADFTLSVHHALAGLLSIACKSTAGHTAIAAGRDTFGCGVLEALACLAAEPKKPVLLIYYDAALPGAYAELEDAPNHAELALALLLGSGGGAGDLMLRVTPAAALVEGAATEQAEQFLSFLLTGRAELISRGERMDWHFRRAA